MTSEQQPLALLLAYEPQSNNLCTDTILGNASLANMLCKANKMSAKYVLILDEEEQKKGTIPVKNMQTKKNFECKQSEVVGKLK
jgi:histidyl-tRNA synthetase